MKKVSRRSFLAIIGVTCTSLTGVDLKGAPDKCWIELTQYGQPITERAEVEFYWDTIMRVVFRPSRAFPCNGASMWRPGEFEPFLHHEFEIMLVTPAHEVMVEWEVRR